MCDDWLSGWQERSKASCCCNTVALQWNEWLFLLDSQWEILKGKITLNCPIVGQLASPFFARFELARSFPALKKELVLKIDMTSSSPTALDNRDESSDRSSWCSTWIKNFYNSEWLNCVRSTMFDCSMQK